MILTRLSKECDISLVFLKHQFGNMVDDVAEEIVVKKAPVVQKRKDAYTTYCERILYFMMSGGEFVLEYQKKLGYFSDAVHRAIANEILYYLNENGSINVADFITYINLKNEYKNEVMDIINSSSNEEMNMDVFHDYVVAINKIMTNNEIKRLKEMIKNELDVDKKMKLTMQIAELKRGSVDNG